MAIVSSRGFNLEDLEKNYQKKYGLDISNQDSSFSPQPVAVNNLEDNYQKSIGDMGGWKATVEGIKDIPSRWADQPYNAWAIASNEAYEKALKELKRSEAIIGGSWNEALENQYMEGLSPEERQLKTIQLKAGVDPYDVSTIEEQRRNIKELEKRAIASNAQLVENAINQFLETPEALREGGKVAFGEQGIVSKILGKPVTTADLYNIPYEASKSIVSMIFGALSRGRGGGGKLERAARGSVISTSAFAALVFPELYAQAEGTHEQKMEQATWGMVFETVPELLPFGIVLGPLKGMFKKILAGSGAEYISEALTETAYITKEILDANPHFKENPEQHIAEFWELFKPHLSRVGHAGKIGGLMGAGMTSPFAAAEAIARRMAPEDVPPPPPPPGPTVEQARSMPDPYGGTIPTVTYDEPTVRDSRIDATIEGAIPGAGVETSGFYGGGTPAGEMAVTYGTEPTLETPEQVESRIKLQQQAAARTQGQEISGEVPSGYEQPFAPIQQPITTAEKDEIEFGDGPPGPQQKERAAAAVLERELANDAEALNSVGKKPMGEEEGAESIINRPKNINEFIAKQLNLTNNDKIRSFFNGLKATGKQALNSIGLSVINTEQGEEILLREAYNTIKIADEVQTKHLNEMGEPERTKEGLPVPRKFEGIPYIFQYGRWIQQKLVTDKSDQLKVIALQRAINPDFEKNYKELEEILRVYGQLYSDTVGGKKLNVEFELNSTDADIGGVYIAGENTLRIPMESLMKGGINGVTAATAVHELLHGKFYSLHELTARRNLKKRGIQNPSKQDVRNETYKVANQFASVILPKMRSLVHKFLKGKIQEYIHNRADTQTNRKKGQEYLSDVLAINNNDPLFGATLEHLEAAAFGNSPLLNQDGTDRAGTLAYVILQEMLAYYKPLADEVTFTARISKEDRRTFIKQFIDGVIKAWKTTFSRDYAPIVVTEDMMLEFGIAVFYDTAGEKITETARKTKFYAAGKTDKDLPDILGQDAGELRSVEQPPRVSIEEEASLPELEEQLVTAKDRLKLLNRRIAPQGFEDEYSPEDFARDISTTKDTINTLKEEIKATRKGLRQRDVGRAEDVDLSKRKFLKQTGGIVAGAAVDPTILVEGATKVAAAAKAPWAGMTAISTTYKFAHAVGTFDEFLDEDVEGEQVFEITYDSQKPNEITVSEDVGDGPELIDTFEIKGEGEVLEMHDIDKIVSDMITEGVTPMGSKTEWTPRNVYSVQEPTRDPWGEEDEGAALTNAGLELYTDADRRFLDNVSGEETKVFGPVDSKETADWARGRESERIERGSGYILSDQDMFKKRHKTGDYKLDTYADETEASYKKRLAEAQKKVGFKPKEVEVEDVATKLLEKALTKKTDELIKEKTKVFTEAIEKEALTDEERRKKKLAAEKAKKEEPKALPAPKDEEGLRQVRNLEELKDDDMTVESIIYDKNGNFKLSDDHTLETTKEPVTLIEVINALSSGKSPTGKNISAHQKTDKPKEFFEIFLRLMYHPEVSTELSKKELVILFNDWNKRIGKIKSIQLYTNDGKKYKGPPKLIQLPETQLKASEVDNVAKQIRTQFPDIIPKAGPGNIIPNFIGAKPGEIRRRKKRNATNVFNAWINQNLDNVSWRKKGTLPDTQELEMLKGAKDKLEAFIKSYYPNGFPKEITKNERFSDEWYFDNKNVTDLVYEKRGMEPKVIGKLSDIIKEQLGQSLRAIIDYTKRRTRQKIAGKNVEERFAVLLNKPYEEIPEGWRGYLTKEIYDEYHKRSLNKQQTKDFIKRKLDVQTTASKRTWDDWGKFTKHLTFKTKIPWSVEHIVDLAISDKVTEWMENFNQEELDSFGLDHPLNWIALPTALNMLARPEEGTIAETYPDELHPLVLKYYEKYFEILKNSSAKQREKINQLKVKAAIDAFNSIKNNKLAKSVDFTKGKTIPAELNLKEIFELRLGTFEAEVEKESLTKNIKQQFQYVKENRIQFENLDNKYTEDEGLRSVSPATEPEATEYKRNAGQHQRFWTNFATFMWSKPVEALRRYRYASLTMAKLADMIQRDPSETKRVSGLKGGLDYIQRKGMAMGQFRVALQASLDVLTGRFGVIDKDTNDAVVKFLVQDTPISDPKIAKAAQRVKEILEGIYVWSHEHGEKGTKGFSLRPLDGGLLPRVWNIEELNTEAGRKKFMKLLERIGIVDNPDAKNDYEKYAATDAYNIAINSGGFISGDFTTTAYNQKSKRIRKYQVELFEKIEKEVSRKDLGTLLVNDLQASLPRFVDKAVEKTLYAELFGHYDEKIWDMKAEIEKEIADYNRKDSTKRRVNPEAAMKEVNDMMDIIRHRYKMDTAWFGARRFTQWFMNFSTVTLMPLVTLASMPEFFTPLALGSKNPVGFMNDLRMAGVYAGLRAMNGMSKVFRGKQLDAMLYPKGKTAKRAMFLKALGIIDIKSQGESAAVRYVGPSFIRTGVAAQGMGSKLIMKNLYKLFGLGNVPKGRFRARKGRAVFNMDTVFEMYLLTTVTQMQQIMAANNLQRYVLSTLKSLSKAQKGKTGLKLDSTIKQQIKTLKDFGLTGAEIKEAIRWYDAGHREFYDVPGEFNWDPRGITLRFVDQVITRPNEATAAKAFKHPGMAPLLLFKSFMTTYANTYMVAIRDRVRFAEGEGTEKAYQQAKMAAGLLATFAAMYGMVLFTQSVRQMIQYGDDDDDYMQDVPEWKKFIGMVNRTGLLTAPGGQLADVWLPYKYGWWQRPSERLESTLFGPGVNQAKSILDLVGDLANKGEVDIEKFLGKVVPVTKYEAFRNIVGVPSYYED